MKKVLFVCIHNSARSQMAEAFLNKLSAGKYQAESAGLEKGTLNPVVVEAMKEVGLDISKNLTKEVAEVLSRGKYFDYVITVCDEASAERCPVIPGASKKLHWSFADPSQFKGTNAEKMVQVREVRDAIKKKVEKFLMTSARR